LPVDAIDQFNQRAGGNAEFGRNPGSMVNVAVKSGTNDLHGTDSLECWRPVVPPVTPTGDDFPRLGPPERKCANRSSHRGAVSRILQSCPALN